MTSEKKVPHNTVREAKVCRDLIRKGFHQHHTAVLAPGFVQANLVILPKVYAADFEGFCRLNPKPCPLLARTEPGETEIKALAVGSDIRTDLPQYRVWKNGEMQRETTNISDLWRDDFVSFLIGCSFSFDNLLSMAKIPVRHRDTGRNVPMFRTNIPCTSVGPFRGNMVVSMRPCIPAMQPSFENFPEGFPFVMEIRSIGVTSKRLELTIFSNRILANRSKSLTGKSPYFGPAGSPLRSLWKMPSWILRSPTNRDICLSRTSGTLSLKAQKRFQTSLPFK